MCLVVCACGAFAACMPLQGGEGDPARAVEDYLAAMVKNETEKLPQLV